MITIKLTVEGNTIERSFTLESLKADQVDLNLVGAEMCKEMYKVLKGDF